MALTILMNHGQYGRMKTAIDIHDELLAREKRPARQTGRPLRAVVDEALRELLVSPQFRTVYRLSDLSVGDPCGEDPLEAYSWQDLCETIHQHPGTP